MRSLLLLALAGLSFHATALDPEELRVAKAETEQPSLLTPLASVAQPLKDKLGAAPTSEQLQAAGHQLWRQAVTLAQSELSDDRPLYWNRLWLRRALKQQGMQDEQLTELERASRGIDDINFDQNADVRILITGFDPFFLDRYLHQSNPSGLAALQLDNQVLTRNGRRAEIEAAMIPVRFEDFDQGMIEALLTPYLTTHKVDMVVTISMGREHFDLERFPGLNRSAKAPGNRNIFTGATHEQPLPPRLMGEELAGPQFVEFSLPVHAMQQVQGRWQVKDNRQVQTLEQGQFAAENLGQLAGQTSVEGSGGGYLSNEISYRAILLGQQLNPDIAIGHIHTPAVRGYEADTEEAIVAQIRAMLTQAIGAL
ncbi:hypothetical protein GCM10011297_10270 [Bacterioplanes sanyensis]|uniref:hypothetical protein n=1 Tax=Bacterioplanes sanyensis TaxID=1249553 RepID=UPI00167BA7A7|nr:hypothetical protein [Bacterioplanes sanyensis]GGY39017.1 hypothetical protein GCM10011297_10270 [Bacterioplanes sanyensis]